MTRFIATKTCGRCGASIYLIKADDHCTWVTDPNKSNAWHCESDPFRPEVAHAPKEELGG
jgi:hypothetical protein